MTIDELVGPESGALDRLLRDALGVATDTAELEVVSYSAGSPATGGLYRLRGEGWSLFCKVLQHPRHWPLLALLPLDAQADFRDGFPWRVELDLWDPPVLASLPDGFRAPVLHRVVDLGDDRLAVWMEDVAKDTGAWDTDRFARAAHLLGRWNARSRTVELLGDHPPGYALRMYAENAVGPRGLGPLSDDALWAHPWLAGHADLRARLCALGDRLPALLDLLDTLPQAMPHGDASPQNLLADARDPGGFVVIDVGMRTPHALGFDLGQLVVGLVHAGELPAARLPSLVDLVLAAYVDGLRAEGDPTVAQEVDLGFATSALIRSGFDSFRYDLLDEPTEAHVHTFAERVALCRFLTDRAEAALASSD